MTPPARLRPSLRARLSALGTGALLCFGAVEASGQSGCEFLPGTRDYHQVPISGGYFITYIGGPILRCDDGVHIRADSAVAFSQERMTRLIGRVRYRDGSRRLESDEARYFSSQGRLQANGNVFVRDTVDGTTIEHGDLVFLRRTDFREQEQINVTTGPDGVRPVATLFMKPPAPDSTAGDSTVAAPDSAAASTTEGPRTPYVVVGDRIDVHGDTYFRATGRVEVERDSLHAFADAAEYDQVAGRILLVGSARVDGPRYDLEARTIQLALPDGDIREIRAIREGRLTGEDLTLESPLITLFLAEGLLERLVAVPMHADSVAAADSAARARPVAYAEDFRLTADSLDVRAPAEALERIFASGRARSDSHARDSLNVDALPAIARSDWLEGDTIIVTFAPAGDSAAAGPPPADASDSALVAAAEALPVPAPESEAAPPDSVDQRYRVERIVARVRARSLYRLIPSDSTVRPGIDPPAVHYVTGTEITIEMRDGEVERMEVLGETKGVHLEPLRAAPDSLPVDSARARVDTAAAVGRASAARPPRSDAAHRPPTSGPVGEPWRRR